jgi:quinoprotein glucose dehydrogenase
MRDAALASLLLVGAVCTPLYAAEPTPGGIANWPYYGGDAGGSRYSPLTQIDRSNVAELKVAWEYHTGDVSDGTDNRRKSEFEATPIVAEGTMYFSTPFNRVIALNPETGQEKWSFDPRIDLHAPYSEGLLNRGVTLWVDPARADGDSCRRRIFLATIDARLFALDATSGQPCADFGAAGQIDLTHGIANITRRGEYEETSAPAIAGDLVVVGSSIADNDRVDSPSGVVRAFDAHTGALRWSWNPIPENIAPTGAGNAWSTISADIGRDLVFVPTTSASPDYHGFKRPGDNKWADSVVALSAKTGQLVWGFQLVHHDLWDYDTAAQPVLATLRRQGTETPVVIAGNKTGNLFVLDRETGKPVFGVEERPVPKSDAEGEEASPTQPFPPAPPPLVPQRLTADDAWGPTPQDRDACHGQIERLRSEGIFTPPSVGGTIAFPGNLGGMNWSSGAFDPERQIFVTNVNIFAMEVHLISRDQYQESEKAVKEGRFRAEVSPQHGTPYGMSRAVLHSPANLPCNPPPWGSLVGVDLSNATIRWNEPLGSTAETWLANAAGNIRGTPNLGGPIVTAAGIVFIAAAMDDYLRAFDLDTGAELWKGKLPAGGQATPMTYRLRPDGKQFVVIAAGGHGKIGAKLGDSVIAFALP